MHSMLRLAALVSVLGASSGSAVAGEPTFPNLVGTWACKSEGALLSREKDVGSMTHWKEGQTRLEAELVVSRQEGRIVHGHFKSARATEPFVGAFGHDARIVHFVDSDGYFDVRLVDAETLESLYRHASPGSAVVSVGVCKRKK